MPPITDHLFVDGGHTIDFTNKAFELLDHLGWEDGDLRAPTLAHGTAASSRSEESGQWRHPFDLVSLLAPTAVTRRPSRTTLEPGRRFGDEQVDALAWSVLAEEPARSWRHSTRPRAAGADDEQLARAVAYAAALRLVRFHTQNDHGDWDVVHHGFTAANATHQMVRRSPTPAVDARHLPGGDEGLPGPLLERPGRPPALARTALPRSADLASSSSAGTARGWSKRQARSSTASLTGGGDQAKRRRRARCGAARRGRRVPLVPGLRGGRAPERGLAGALRAGGADPHRAGPLPRRAHPHTPRLPRSSASPRAFAAARRSTRRCEAGGWIGRASVGDVEGRGRGIGVRKSRPLPGWWVHVPLRSRRTSNPRPNQLATVWILSFVFSFAVAPTATRMIAQTTAHPML